jgi:hypothetical protein
VHNDAGVEPRGTRNAVSESAISAYPTAWRLAARLGGQSCIWLRPHAYMYAVGRRDHRQVRALRAA